MAKYRYVKGGKSQNEVDDDGARYEAQQFFELETVTEDELTRRFKQAHQALWGGGELNPSEAFDELDKLIFCKIWDEKYALDSSKKVSLIFFRYSAKIQKKKRFKNYMIALNLFTP